MTIAFALILIFVLYLIDKHGLWRRAAKVCLWGIGTLVVIGGIFWLWENKKEEASKAHWQPIWDCEARNSQFLNATEECEKNPQVVLHPVENNVTIDKAVVLPHPEKRFGNARVVPDFTLLWGCDSPTMITSVYHTTRVKILSVFSTHQVRVQIPDGRIGCLEQEEVQRDNTP